MPALHLPDIDEATLERLAARARQNGRSVEEEAKAILAAASGPPPDPDAVWERIDRRRERLAVTHPQTSDSVDLLREDRER